MLKLKLEIFCVSETKWLTVTSEATVAPLYTLAAPAGILSRCSKNGWATVAPLYTLAAPEVIWSRCSKNWVGDSGATVHTSSTCGNLEQVLKELGGRVGDDGKGCDQVQQQHNLHHHNKHF